EDLGLQLLPLVRSDHGDALDVVGVAREKLDFLPACRPLGAGHRRQIREDPDRPLLALLDRTLELGEEGRDLVRGDAAAHSEAERLLAALRKSLDHGRASSAAHDIAGAQETEPGSWRR